MQGPVEVGVMAAVGEEDKGIQAAVGVFTGQAVRVEDTMIKAAVRVEDNGIWAAVGVMVDHRIFTAVEKTRGFRQHLGLAKMMIQAVGVEDVTGIKAAVGGRGQWDLA